MHAQAGDRIVVRGHHVGEPDRDALVLGVEGVDGSPPYRVKWSDGRESVYFPGSDAFVLHEPGEARTD